MEHWLQIHNEVGPLRQSNLVFLVWDLMLRHYSPGSHTGILLRRKGLRKIGYDIEVNLCR